MVLTKIAFNTYRRRATKIIKLFIVGFVNFNKVFQISEQYYSAMFLVRYDRITSSSCRILTTTISILHSLHQVT